MLGMGHPGSCALKLWKTRLFGLGFRVGFRGSALSSLLVPTLFKMGL